jgi:hypothetical protein
VPDGCEPLTESEDEDGDAIMTEVSNPRPTPRRDGKQEEKKQADSRSKKDDKSNGSSSKQDSANANSSNLAAPNSTNPAKAKPVSLLDEYADSIRRNVLQRGYGETMQAWITSPQYTGSTNQEQRDETMAYLRYCRDLALTFDRHGAARTREILEALPVQRRLRDDWSQRIIYNSWFDARNSRENGRRWLAGWVSQSWDQAVADRSTRIELLSLNGQDDVLYELTEFDTEYVPIFGPQLGPVQHRDAVFQSSEQRNTQQNLPTEPQDGATATVNATSLRVKEELLAGLDSAPTTAENNRGGRRDHSREGEVANGLELYDPADPTTESTNSTASAAASTARPNVDELPPLLLAMVFRSSTPK